MRHHAMVVAVVVAVVASVEGLVAPRRASAGSAPPRRSGSPTAPRPSAARPLVVRSGVAEVLADVGLSGASAKNALIGVWLFGGLVPALIGINGYAMSKSQAPAKYEGFVDTDAAKVAGGAAQLPLASIGAPDVVLAEDVAAVLDAYAAAYDARAFVPLSAALGAAGGGDAVPGQPLYLARADFKTAVSRRLRSAPDAAVDAVFNAWAGGSGVAVQGKVDGALASWRAADGASWDLAAVDRGIFGGTGSVALGFAGLLVLDALALVFFVGAIRSVVLGAE